MTIPEAFQMALRRHQAGRLAEAEALYRQILAAQPNHADALHLLGVIAQQGGRHDLAVEWIGQAIALDPKNPAAHCNLGEALRVTRRSQEAMHAFHRALELKPDYPEAHNNLGNAYRDLGQMNEAIAAYHRAVALKPALPEAHVNLGNALADLGQIDDAIVNFRRALGLRSNFPEAHIQLGNALGNRGETDEAIASYRRALKLQPNSPEAHNNLGNTLRHLGRLDEAVAHFKRALELKPDFTEAHNNLGNAQRDGGQLDEAIAGYRRALELNPDQAATHSNLIYALHFHPGQTRRAIGEEQRKWNCQFGDPLKQHWLPHANDPAPAGRLRIGYVSPAFWDHVTGRYLLPLFENHDRAMFEIICYSGAVRSDKSTEEFQRRAVHWRNTVGVCDAALAELICRDSVDILVDLTQHMAGNRLPMFARKPAPVQVSFAGYPDGTGLKAIEYRISDRHLEPGDSAGRNDRVCLIDSFWCYDPCGTNVKVNELPAAETGSVTFGCLNNFCKVNDRTLALWARVLANVSGSRLLLLSGAGSHRQRTLKVFENEGLDPSRVEFVEFRPRERYLELYHHLDIVLDTFPYNGHTTSLDALWMGVPVVSLAGDTPVSRAGLSQLTNLGLPELIASSGTDYVHIAEKLAGDLPRLAQLRSSLRDRMENSVLMDAPRFARQVEQAYREMWRAWCAGK